MTLAMSCGSLLSALWAETHKEMWANAVMAAGALTIAAAVAPAGLYVVCTRRITRALCEVPMMGVAVGIVVADVGATAQDWQSLTSFNVLLLDCLLLCGCDGVTTKLVLGLSVGWMLVRAVLVNENMQADDCMEPATRFSPLYFFWVVLSATPLLVVVVDFHFTRGFARSMREQQSVVAASIGMVELAAISLSRYRTGAAEELLLGPDSKDIPDGLREALLQLVANLARYRPYLPQSCFNDAESDSELQSASTQSAAVSGLAPRQATQDTFVWAARRSSARSGSEVSTPVASAGPDTKQRKVSLVAVNSKAFLEAVQAAGPVTAVAAFVRSEVGTFVGEVQAERGVVDLVSGDHMLANFNVSRMCTAHRAGAARVAWRLTQATGEVLRGRQLKRTGCACSGAVLCGDFGTSELRRQMILGTTVNTVHCLERVAAWMGTVLVDEAVGADADVCSAFVSVLVERVAFAKQGPKPFLVWKLQASRGGDQSPDEWMYELARQAEHPHAAWNELMSEWLSFGSPLTPAAAAAAPFTAAEDSLTAERQQTRLVEAALVGATVSADPGAVSVAQL